MLDSQHLLELARELSETRSAGAPRQVVLRRAISTAYYAVFHCLSGSVSSTFVPKTLWQSQVLFYRALDHARSRDRCKRLGLKTLPAAEKDFFGRDFFNEGIRTFANSFVELQELRHEADYDPNTKFSKDEVKQIVDTAERAIECLDSADAAERTLFLAYLLFGIRAP